MEDLKAALVTQQALWHHRLMRLILALLTCLAALPTQAQDRKLTPEEFERFVTGSTILFQSRAREYGAEEYLDNRRVRWSFLDGDCTEGHWYAQGPQICFVYDDYPDPQCWQFYVRQGRLVALFEDDPEATELIEFGRRDGPLYCLGPEVGV